MNPDLLVSPVVLRPESHVEGVLRILESVLDLCLTPVCQDDFLGAPVVPCGDQDPPAAMLFDKCIKFVLFNPETELKRIAVELMEIPSDKALEIVGRQKGLDPFFDPFSAPFSSPRSWFAQGGFEFLQGGERLCQALFNASNLPLTELLGDVDHTCEIKPPNGLTASIAGQILPPQGEGCHGSVRFLDQLLVVGGRQCCDKVKILLYTAQDLLGVVPLVEDDRKVLQRPAYGFEPCNDLRQSLVEDSAVLEIALVEGMKQWYAMGPGDQEEQSELPEIHPPLLVLATLSKGASGVCRVDVGEEIGRVVHQRIQGNPFLLAEGGNDLMLDVSNSFTGQGIHLVPKVLTVKPGKGHAQDQSQGGFPCPTDVPIALACGMADSSNGGEQEGSADGKTVSEARKGHMAIYGFDDLELFCELEKQGDIAVDVTAHLFGNSFGEPLEQAFSGSEVFEDNGPWLAVDSSALDDGPVSVASGRSFLDGSHISVYATIQKSGCQ